MIVKIIGECETADRARAMIHHGGGRVVDHGPRFTFVIREYLANDDDVHVTPIVDGVASPLESAFVTLLSELTPEGTVTLRRKEGNQDDHVIIVDVPARDRDRHATALAVYRTVAQLSQPKKRRWLSFFGAVLLLTCLPSRAVAQAGATTIVDAAGNTNTMTGNALDVNIKSGGSGGGVVTQGALDATAVPWKINLFSGSTIVPLPTALGGNGGFKIDFAAAQHAIIDSGAVTVSGTVTANAGTSLNTSALALSATQTDRTQKTQITDGTRDGTVKAASTLPAATDTALVVTQRDAIPAGSNVIGHVVTDTGSTTAVTGTVTVSGTVTANAGTNLNTSALALEATQTSGGAKTQITDSSGNAVVVRTSDPISSDRAAVVRNIPSGTQSVVQTAPAASTASLSTTTCPGAGCLDVSVTGMNGLGLYVSGTWSGTLAFKGSVDGSDFGDSINGYVFLRPMTGSSLPYQAPVGATATNGTYVGAVGGLKSVRIYFLSYTSGTANVTVQPNPESSDIYRNWHLELATDTARVYNGEPSTPFNVRVFDGTRTAQVTTTAGGSLQVENLTGRTRVTFTADRVTPSATDTLVTFVKNVGGTATTGQTTYAVTAAKKFRLQAFFIGAADSTTTAVSVRVAFRENTGGTCTASSAAVVMGNTATPAATAATGSSGVNIAIPDGLEFPASDSLCISAIASTSTGTLTITAIGFEY